ncbi:MAG: PHP domain-containing protein [Mariniphaga sp.]
MNFLSNTQKYTLAGILMGIVILSVFFPFPIHIENALTLETVPDFGIHISVWKTLFEPVLGLLLFYNRSFHSLTEMRLLLFWVLAVFIVYSLIKSFLIKNKQKRSRFVVIQLVNIPIVIGLWFVVFVIIVFIPLPNNTIINNSPNSVLVTTHSHTQFSHDGLISQEGLWKWHKRNGFDAFFITDHNNHDQTFDFVQAQRNNKFPQEPLVICGEEFSGSNHLSLLGLKEKFSTKGISDSTAIRLAHAANNAVIANHWFDGERNSLEYYKNLNVDGFEIENSGTDLTYERDVYQKIKDFCGRNALIMNGGLDFHGYGNACSLWNAFEIPGWKNLTPVLKEEAILNILKTHDQSKLKVLLYKDRPYYTKRYLLFSPVFTFINYFRTLNSYQVTSWIFWILVMTWVINIDDKKNRVAKQSASQRFIPVLGVIGALFLVSLGAVYYAQIKMIEDYTKMYHEYSELLFYVGTVFLVYSGVVLFFRNFNRKG